MKLKDENYKKNCGSIMGLCFSLNFKNKFQVGMVNFFFFFWLYHLSYEEISLQFLVYRWISSRQTKPTPSTQIWPP